RDRQRRRPSQLGLAEGGEPRMHLGRRMVRTEIVRVRVDAPLPKLLELFPPDHDLLVVFGHAAETECVYWLPGGGSNNYIWGPVQCSGAARPAPFRCPQTPSASMSALALGLPHIRGPVRRSSVEHVRIADGPRPGPLLEVLHIAQQDSLRYTWAHAGGNDGQDLGPQA